MDNSLDLSQLSHAPEYSKKQLIQYIEQLWESIAFILQSPQYFFASASKPGETEQKITELKKKASELQSYYDLNIRWHPKRQELPQGAITEIQCKLYLLQEKLSPLLSAKLLVLRLIQNMVSFLPIPFYIDSLIASIPPAVSAYHNGDNFSLSEGKKTILRKLLLDTLSRSYIIQEDHKDFQKLLNLLVDQHDTASIEMTQILIFTSIKNKYNGDKKHIIDGIRGLIYLHIVESYLLTYMVQNCVKKIEICTAKITNSLKSNNSTESYIIPTREQTLKKLEEVSNHLGSHLSQQDYEQLQKKLESSYDWYKDRQKKLDEITAIAKNISGKILNSSFRESQGSFEVDYQKMRDLAEEMYDTKLNDSIFNLEQAAKYRKQALSSKEDLSEKNSPPARGEIRVAQPPSYYKPQGPSYTGR